MKKYLVFLLVLILFALKSFIIYEKPVNNPNIVQTVYHSDIHNSILEFVSDSLPVDSLYIPEFIKE